MNAGRELDMLVAEKVLGWYDIVNGVGYATGKNSNGRTGVIRPYSTDIAAAWQVVERMCDNEAFHTECDDLIGLSRQTAMNTARIICIAALKAVGVEVQ